MKRVLLLILLVASVVFPPKLFAQPKEKIDSLQGIISSGNKDTNEVIALYMLARYTKWSDTEAAMKLAMQSLVLAKHLDYNSGKTYAYNTVGIILQDKGEFNSSLLYLDSSLTFAREVNDSNAIGMSLNNIGLVYLEQGSYESALENLISAAQIRELTGDKRGQAGSFNNIGLLYAYMNDHRKAIEYYEKSMTLKQQLGDQQGIANTYLNIGLSYDGLKDTTLERQNYRSALALYLEIGDLNGQAMVYNNFGEIWLYEKQFQRSLESHYKAYALRTELDDRVGLAQSGTNIAACLIQLDSLEKAKEYLDVSLQIAREESAMEELVLAYSVQSDYYVAKGDFESALSSFKLSSAIQDSILNEESTKNVQALEAKYQAEKKEKDILQLQANAERAENRKNLIILISVSAVLMLVLIGGFSFSKYRTRQHQLRELAVLETKESERIRIARDMHDDLGSGLTRISLLSEQVKSQIQKSDTTSTFSHLDKLTGESRQLTRNLGEIVWTLSPKNDRLPDLAAYIRNHALDFLEEAHINCSFDFPDDIPDLVVNAETRRNVFLCIKEILNNAVKYSKATEVKIHLQTGTNSFSLSVADNGAGFDHTALKRVNGLNNMRRRMEDSGATFRFESAPGTGTTLFLGNIPASSTTIV